MGNRACLKNFAKYSSLNALGMLGLSCYILADTFFVAKGLGADGLAALNLAIPVYSFIHGSGLLIGMGGGIRHSILKGRGDRASVDEAFTNAVFLTLALSAAFFALGLCSSASIARALGADGAVYEMSRIYLQVILLFSPMFLCNNVLLCFVRNDGAPQLSMAAMLGGSFSNILLDYIFIFPLHMGIFGAALATGIAPAVSMLTLLPFFLKSPLAPAIGRSTINKSCESAFGIPGCMPPKRRRNFHSKKNSFHLCSCRISRRQWAGIFSGGLPSLITEVSSGTVILVFNKIILRLQGNVGVAAYGVIANLSLVVMAIFTGIAQGIQPILSDNYGKGCLVNIRAILRYALWTTAFLSTALYGCIFLGADAIAGIFNSERSARLQAIAVQGLRCYFTACAFAGFNIILSAYFAATERGRPAHVLSLLRGFVILIPMAFLLSFADGMTGVWLAFPVTEAIVSLLGAACYRRLLL